MCFNFIIVKKKIKIILELKLSNANIAGDLAVYSELCISFLFKCVITRDASSTWTKHIYSHESYKLLLLLVPRGCGYILSM